MLVLRALLLGGTASLLASPAVAADTLKIGPAPAWVHGRDIPPAKATDAPVQLLLEDQQIALERGKVTTYTEGALRIQNGQGLAAGNLAIVWQPATDTLTVNKLHIIRGGKVIDVLASGQTFTVLRRETNLDAATLDGTLTATLQPEGLQEGDILDLATTLERSDPVLKGHVEAMFGGWGGLPIQLAHVGVQWPSDLRLNVRQTADLPAAQRSSANGMNLLELNGRDVQPLVPPKGAPDRFRIGRFAEATDYASWSDIAGLMMPLFRTASAIPASGPLHDEVEKIRTSTADPQARATQALALVQDRVRYVALLMGQGGYVPATAEQTWSRRFGDCKAKTALLLGILQSLGIKAEPVLVQAKLGDMIADRLPMIGLFNHVLVRAHIGAKEYWLDGTRTGDTDLGAIEIPDFGWVLPVVENAQLVHLIPHPLDVPNVEHRVSIDASAGVYAPAQITVEEINRGDSAVALNTIYSSVTAEQRDEAMHDTAKGYFDGFTISSSSVKFDKAKRTFDVTVKGTAKLNWKDGWFYVPTSSVGYDPDFDRTPGPFHDVPMAVTYPHYAKDVATVRLPAGFAAKEKLSPKVHEVLAGVEYARTETVSGDTLEVVSSERSVAPEVPYKEAVLAEPRIRALDKDDVYLNVDTAYVPTAKDTAALKDSKPQTADDYFVRAGAEMASNDYDGAIADLTAGLALDPKNAWALRKRAVIKIDKDDIASGEKDAADAAQLEPGSPDVLRIRAYLAEKKNDLAGAVDAYQKLIDKDPKDGYSLTHRGMSLVSLGRNDEALPNLNAALTINPKDTLALINKAMAEQNMGDFDAADRDAKAVQAIAPTIPASYLVQGMVLQARGDFPHAIERFSKSAEVAKADGKEAAYVEPLSRRAKAYLALGQYDQALADTEQMLKLGKKDTDTRLLRANIYALRGDPTAAAAEAAAMMKENPKEEYAFVAAGKTYAALGQPNKAMAAFDKAIAIHPYGYVYLNREQVRPRSDVAGRLADLNAGLKAEPDNEDLPVEKARLLARTGDYKGALELLDHAKRDQTSRYPDIERAIVLYKAGRTDEARTLLQQVRASSKTANEFNSLCWEQATADIMLDAALQDCRNALKLSPGAGSYLDSLGMVLLKLGKLDEALQAYNQAIAKNTGAASLMGRSFVYQRKGDRAHADADAAAARKITRTIDDNFAEYGLTMGHARQTDKAVAAVTRQ